MFDSISYCQQFIVTFQKCNTSGEQYQRMIISRFAVLTSERHGHSRTISIEENFFEVVKNDRLPLLVAVTGSSSIKISFISRYEFI